jgi:hypothetical protein
MPRTEQAASLDFLFKNVDFLFQVLQHPLDFFLKDATLYTCSSSSIVRLSVFQSERHCWGFHTDKKENHTFVAK